MKSVVYGAKSTEDLRGSIPTQLDDCRKMAEREGWEIVGEYQDEAKSAYHGSRGDGLTRAKEHAARVAAEEGACALVVQHTDRLARGDAVQAAHLIEVVLWARKAAVTIRSVQDDSTCENLVMAVVMGERNHEDSRRKALAVKAGMKRRAERGSFVGQPPYGYRKRDTDPESGKPTGPLVIHAAEAETVRRVFTDYASGRGQRAIVRALNDDGIPTATGRRWQQSRITRMLSNVAYAGKVALHDDVLPGSHEAIVDDELWARVQTVRAGGSRRKGGRHADGAHLLVRGILRCPCGSAMLPRKARPGVERERYVCRGRIEHGSDFCSQPSIRREAIDGPLLATLLDSYIDLDATRQRIEDRASSALTAAREALEQAERDAGTAEAKLARVRGHYQAGKIEAADWSEQRPQLTAELDAATEAAQRAREHVQRVEQGGVPGDAEQALLDHLAALKRAVGEGVGAAPDLHALRNTIGDLFESIRLVRSGRLPVGDLGEGFTPIDGDVPAVTDGQERYWLLLSLRWSAVDRETFSPIGQAIPVPPEQSYPFTFFARYCWW
jgi:site-specific DNA recombinase